MVLSARNEARTKGLAERLIADGHEVHVRTVDAGDPVGVAALVSDVEGEFGGIDVLHYNAASMRAATLADQPLDTFNGDLAVDIGGALAAVRTSAPEMTARGSGSILLTGGGFAVEPHPDYLSLSIGKAGIRAFAQAVFERFKEKGVHVATVMVAGVVGTAEDADAVAERFWRLHSQPIGSWEMETVYAPVG